MTKTGRSRSGDARALALSAERRAEIARKAATSRWDKDLPEAEFEGDFSLGPPRYPARCCRMARALSPKPPFFGC